MNAKRRGKKTEMPTRAARFPSAFSILDFDFISNWMNP